jgi:hypothetical protein
MSQSFVQKIILLIVGIVILATAAAVLLANLGWWVQGGATQQHFAQWGSGVLLAEILGLFGLIARWAYNLHPISIDIAPAPEFPTLNPGTVFWSDSRCFVKSGDFKAEVKLVRYGSGHTWRVHMPQKVLDRIAKDELIEFRFEDQRGIEWAAGPLLRNQYVINLQCLERERVRKSYRDKQQ